MVRSLPFSTVIQVRADELIAFQTAVSLAEYEDTKDEEGKIMLTDEHLRAVVELSKDFKKYLKELHRADEDKRALRRFERLDT